MTGGLAWWLALACAVVFGSCESPRSAPVALPPRPHVVHVDMTEYRFDYDPAIPPGRSLVRVGNTGTVPHSLSVLPLTDDIPPIDQQLRGSRRLGIVPFAGVGSLEPGESTTFAVDLTPGVRYAFVCFVTNSEGQPHALLGMASEFRAGGGRATTGMQSSTFSSSPPPDASPFDIGAPPR